MIQKRSEIKFRTRGNKDVVDITAEVSHELRKSGLKEGLVSLFVPGATGALTTIENEPGLIEDFKDMLNRLIPDKPGYKHHDDNAHSHLGASFLGPSLVVPFSAGALQLGRWQQVIFVDFDNRERDRTIIVKIMGE